MPNTAFITASFFKSLTLLALAMLSVGVSFVDAQVFDRVINLPGDPIFGDSISESIGGDELSTQLNVANGGTVGNDFDSRGSEVNISGGVVGENFSPIGGIVNITGGTVGERLFSNFRAVINISGGTVGQAFIAQSTVVNISGGVVGNNFRARSSNTINISGGTVGDNFSVIVGNEVNISGGTIGDAIRVERRNQMHLFGSEFVLDGVPVSGLVLDRAFTITDRDVTLTGLLSDGTAFSFDLNTTDTEEGEDFFASDATLTVTLGAPLLLADIDLDGVVNFLDISPFISLLSNGEFQGEADIDRNGLVNFLDIAPFIDLLSSSQ